MIVPLSGGRSERLEAWVGGDEKELGGMVDGVVEAFW